MVGAKLRRWSSSSMPADNGSQDTSCDPHATRLVERASRVASAAPAASLCAGHVQQLGGASPPANLMEVKA